MIPQAAITLLCLVTSLKYDGIGAFAENRQNLQAMSRDCQKRVDEKFIRFAATFKGNFSRTYENIAELMETYVSSCWLLLSQFETFLSKDVLKVNNKHNSATFMLFIVTFTQIFAQRGDTVDGFFAILILFSKVSLLLIP